MTMPKTITPLHAVAAIFSAGSMLYGLAGFWPGKMVESSFLPGELFQDIQADGDPTTSQSGRPATGPEKVLYKNYVIGLFMTPAITLIFGLSDGSRSVVKLSAATVAISQGLYSLHLTSIPKNVFKKNIREVAAFSHGIISAICVWEAWRRR